VIAALEQFCQVIVGPQGAQAETQRRTFLPRSEESLDLAEDSAGARKADPGEGADELVAANAHHGVIGAKLRPQRVSHSLQEGVAGSMAMLVVDMLEPVDVAIGEGQASARALGALDLVLQDPRPEGGAKAARQVVELRLLELDCSLLAVQRCLFSVLCRTHAVLRRLCPIFSRGSARLGRVAAVFVPQGTLKVLGIPVA
jgi:hypothetical protein